MTVNALTTLLISRNSLSETQLVLLSCRGTSEGYISFLLYCQDRARCVFLSSKMWNNPVRGPGKTTKHALSPVVSLYILTGPQATRTYPFAHIVYIMPAYTISIHRAIERLFSPIHIHTRKHTSEFVLQRERYLSRVLQVHTLRPACNLP